MTVLEPFARPGASRPIRDPDLLPYKPAKLWRLHNEEDPNRPPRYPSGKYRFDAPDGSYDVTYGNASRKHTFLEVYGDIKESQIVQGQAERQISFAAVSRPLQLIDLSDGATVRRLGTDTGICNTPDYPSTMAWSAQLREWYPDADGFHFIGRRAGSKPNVALLLERCGDSLSWTCCGSLVDNADAVTEASDAYDLVFDFVLNDPYVTSDWPDDSDEDDQDIEDDAGWP